MIARSLRVQADAQRLLLKAAEIETLPRTHKNPFEGDLRFGSIPTIGPSLLPRALPAIREAMPNLRVFLREEMTESLLGGDWLAAWTLC